MKRALERAARELQLESWSTPSPPDASLSVPVGVFTAAVAVAAGVPVQATGLTWPLAPGGRGGRDPAGVPPRPRTPPCGFTGRRGSDVREAPVTAIKACFAAIFELELGTLRSAATCQSVRHRPQRRWCSTGVLTVLANKQQQPASPQPKRARQVPDAHGRMPVRYLRWPAGPLAG